MKRSEVEVGKTYTAKVSDKLVPVRITCDLGTNRTWTRGYAYGRRETHAGWDAMNLSTHRQIHIRSAARLRGEYKPPRCGECANCVTMRAEKPDWNVRYTMAHAALADSTATLIRNAWKARCAQLPCLKPEGAA